MPPLANFALIISSSSLLFAASKSLFFASAAAALTYKLDTNKYIKYKYKREGGGRGVIEKTKTYGRKKCNHGNNF